MLTRKLAACFGLAAVLTTGAMACAPSSSSAPEDGTDQEVDSLGSSQRSYVVIQRDYRKCAWPMCSGFYVKDVNRKNAKWTYVSALDFDGSGLDEATAGLAEDAPGEVVLYGKLGDLPDWDDSAMKTFRVEKAWRGMPGEVAAETDVFYEVAAIEPPVTCLVAPCPALTIKQLHKKATKQIERVDLEGLSEVRLDRNWLGDRVAHGGALVAGTVVDGEIFQGGPERVLQASQAFVQLPEEQGQCPQSRPGCPEGQEAIYSRDENRCVVLSGCVEPGACAAYVPTCNEGYTLVGWTGGMFACTVYACDPTFVVPAEEEVTQDDTSSDDSVDESADDASEG